MHRAHLKVHSIRALQILNLTWVYEALNLLYSSRKNNLVPTTPAAASHKTTKGSAGGCLSSLSQTACQTIRRTQEKTRISIGSGQSYATWACIKPHKDQCYSAFWLQSAYHESSSFDKQHKRVPDEHDDTICAEPLKRNYGSSESPWG